MAAPALTPTPRPKCPQVLTGSPDAALASVAGVSSLLNAGAQQQGGAASRRGRSPPALSAAGGDARRALLQAAGEAPTPEEQARAEHRSTLLGVVGDVLVVSAPSPMVRHGFLPPRPRRALCRAPRSYAVGALTRLLAATNRSWKLWPAP